MDHAEVGIDRRVDIYEKRKSVVSQLECVINWHTPSIHASLPFQSSQPELIYAC